MNKYHNTHAQLRLHKATGSARMDEWTDGQIEVRVLRTFRFRLPRERASWSLWSHTVPMNLTPLVPVPNSNPIFLSAQREASLQLIEPRQWSQKKKEAGSPRARTQPVNRSEEDEKDN